MPTTAQTRITGGEWRGRLLNTPREQLLRPTRSLVREALFSILADSVVGARVVDLFAGAGTVGFEALSRGAAHATFVDSEERALAHVGATAQRFGCADRCRVIRADALQWVRTRATELGDAGIVFLDAPYRDDTIDDVLRALGEAPPPLVVCEHHRARVLPDRVGRLVVIRRVRYGITGLSVLRASDKEVGDGE
jgi:16S rRNA (guanine966-N2)-methyltransferase